MNYIAKLQAELAERDRQIAAYQNALRNFHVFLHSPKFVGTGTDGSRKDWIATGDVINWIRETDSTATSA